MGGEDRIDLFPMRGSLKPEFLPSSGQALLLTPPLNLLVLYTTCCNTKQHCTANFRGILTTKRDYFPKYHLPTGFYTIKRLSSLWVKKSSFLYDFGYRLPWLNTRLKLWTSFIPLFLLPVLLWVYSHQLGHSAVLSDVSSRTHGGKRSETPTTMSITIPKRSRPAVWTRAP